MFEESPNKIAVRQLWDLPIIRRWAGRVGGPLSYFGLPGPLAITQICGGPKVGYLIDCAKACS